MKKFGYLKKFSTRAIIETLIKSLIFAVIAGFTFSALVIFILHSLQLKSLLGTIFLIIIPFLGAFAVGFFVLFAPKEQNYGRRLDDLGLDERVGTMLEFAEVDTYIAQKQREDTNNKLEEVDPKMVKFRLSKIMYVFLALAMLLAVPTFLLPNNLISSQERDRQEKADEINDLIDELAEELRDIIDNANISDSLKESLHDRVDQMQEDAKAESDPTEKINIVRREHENIMKIIADNLIESEESKEDFQDAIDELKKNPDTKELGEALEEAIANDDAKSVVDALEKLKEEIAGSANEGAIQKIKDAAETLENAAGMMPTGAIKEAIGNLGENLGSIAEQNTGNPSEGKKEAVKEISDAISELQNAIKERKEVKEKKEVIDKTFKDALGEMEGINGNPTGNEGANPNPDGQGNPTGNEGENPNPDGQGNPTGNEGTNPNPEGEGNPTGNEGENPNPEGEGNPTGNESPNENPTGNPSENENPTQNSSGENDGDGRNEGSVGKPNTIEKEKIIDGKTEYTELSDEYVKYLNDALNSGLLTERQKAIITQYIEMIEAKNVPDV